MCGETRGNSEERMPGNPRRKPRREVVTYREATRQAWCAVGGARGLGEGLQDDQDVRSGQHDLHDGVGHRRFDEPGERER